MIDHIERPLTPAERRLLRLAISGTERNVARLWRRLLGSMAVVIGPLWLVTLLVTKEPFWFVTSSWAVAGLLIGGWVALTERGTCRRRRAEIRRALDHDRARELRVRCTEAAVIEDPEDFGPIWIFQVGDDELLLLSGQELDVAQVPSTDFSYVEIDVAPNEPLRTLFRVRGSPIEPLEVLPSIVWRALEVETTVTTRRGTLRAEIERLRARARAD